MADFIEGYSTQYWSESPGVRASGRRMKTCAKSTVISPKPPNNFAGICAFHHPLFTTHPSPPTTRYFNTNLNYTCKNNRLMR